MKLFNGNFPKKTVKTRLLNVKYNYEMKKLLTQILRSEISFRILVNPDKRPYNISEASKCKKNKIKDSTFAMTTVGCAVVDCRGVHSLDPERSRSRKIALIKPSSSQTQK